MKSLQLNKPHLLVMIGVAGSGKSAFARQFAQTFNAPIVDYAEIRQLSGEASLSFTFAEYLISQLLRTKQTMIVDGPGDKLSDRKEIVKLAANHGYVPLFIWVQTEPATAEYRAVQMKGAPLTKSQYDDRVNDFQFPSKSEPVIVISGKHTYPSQARTVLKKLVVERPSMEAKIETPPPRSTLSRGRTIR